MFLDLRFTALKNPTGVTKHILNMVKGLSGYRNIDIEILAAYDQLDANRKIPPDNALHDFRAKSLPLAWHLSNILWAVSGLPLIENFCSGYDWIYCPKNDFIPSNKTRVAYTIHALREIDHILPESFLVQEVLRRQRALLVYKRIVRRGNIIFSVSEFLKEQIVDLLNVNPERIVVLGNGVEQVYFEADKMPLGISGEPAERPYILVVGELSYDDGGDRVVEIAGLLKKQMPNLRIIVAGCLYDARIKEKADRLDNIEIRGYIPSEQLVFLMRDARALLYLPRHETFGIAAAEAMAVGLPVITTRSTAIPETVGDAGIYINENDNNEIMEVIKKVVYEGGFYKKYSIEGKKRAAMYGWDVCVRKLYNALVSYK